VRGHFALGGLALAVIAGLAVVLLVPHQERTGVNEIAPNLYVQSLRTREVACQGATLPAGSRTLGLTVGTYGKPGPQLRVSLIGPTERYSFNVQGGYPGGALKVAIRPVKREAPATVCIQNLGRSALALGGVAGGLGSSTLDGHPSTAALHIDYYDAEHNALGLAPIVARRVGLLAFGGAGSWVLWALIVLMAIAGGSAVLLVLRDARSERT
jgi:hypothetical protein